MRTRRFLLASLVMAGTAALSGCGFSPMYGAGSTMHALSDMRVETGQDRIDFHLQQALLDRMDARHASGPYTLVAETSSRIRGLGLGTDDVARRYAIALDVRFYVLREGELEPVASGRVSSSAAYNDPREAYASEIARRDAETRAADAAAERIILQLSRIMRESETW